MVSRYRQPALITWTRHLRSALLQGIIALLLHIALLSPAVSAADQSPALRPYTAQYKTTARGFKLDITRKLETDDANHFVLTNGGKILVVGFHEISVFTVEENRVLPISYVYQGTGLVNRRRELHFDSDANRINSLYKGEWYQLPYSESTLDRMSQVEQLRLLLLQDPGAARDIALRVADGKRVKDSRLVLIAQETLQTPMGPVETLHYERLHDDPDRKSDLWFAPQWDYLMVKTVHIEDGDPVEMTLTSATIEGESVSLN
ncbi:MAG: DUF3108 domain-containing protein [Halieaceae bacterium]|jgi:hypothetical protein|nr:DUF3108 domain-containing protein [Halieaceae bacterium]